MDCPKQMLPSTLEHHHHVVVFFHHIYDYFILCDNWNLVSFFYIQISTKKQFSSKKFLRKCLFKTPLWREIDNAYFNFLISSKNLNWNNTYIPIYSWIAYFWTCLFEEAKHRGGNEAEARGSDEQQLSDKPPLIRCGENYSAWQ